MPLIYFLFLSLLFACSKTTNPILDESEPLPALEKTLSIEYNGVGVDIVIDKPEGNELDVLMVFHGTVWYDSLILQAANNALNAFKNILDREDMMIISVAYPEEGLLFGDNIAHCEAALLWLRNKASEEIGVTPKNIFLAGHSQGGYHATRLNTMHSTAGVIANGAGPLNLVFRCQLEENGQIPNGYVCDLLNTEYGLPSQNSNPYFERSLRYFTNGHLADILFVQGMEDSPIQMHSWPIFKEEMMSCTNCHETLFLELEAMGHQALFQSPAARTAFNNFINERL